MFEPSKLLENLLIGTASEDVFKRSRTEVDENIRRQMSIIRQHLTIDPGSPDEPGDEQTRQEIIGLARAKYNFNGTKLGWYKERVEALREGKKIAPVTIDMALTQWCNRGCKFCYAGLQQNPLSAVSWDRWSQFLDDCVSIGHRPGAGVRGLTLISDGESTGSPYFMDFVRKARSNGIKVALGTNGVPIKRGDIPELAESLTYVRFNLNAADPHVNSQIMDAQTRDMRPQDFHTVIDIIKDFVREKKERGLNVTIGLQQVLMPWYFDQVIPLAQLGKELGVDYTVIKHCSDDEKGRLGIARHYGAYKEPTPLRMLDFAEAISTADYSAQAKRAKMMTGKDRLYDRCDGTPILLQISGSGVIAPCGSFFNPMYKRFHIGYLQEQTFKEMWESSRYDEIMAHLKSPKFDPRGRCAEICHQHHVNEDLYNDFVHGIAIPDLNMSGKEEPRHLEFLTS